MAALSNTNAFFESVAAYERFMGRYARPLAKEFVQTIPLASGDSVLDIGCGPGALTAELVAAVGAGSVSVIDPSPPFLAYCVGEYPGITAEVAKAENIPFADHAFSAVFSQLVIHFIGDLPQAGCEIMRVTKPGGSVAVCTWDVGRMQKINLLPRAAKASGIEVPPLPVEDFGEDDSVARYLESIGLEGVETSTITVKSTYGDFGELWNSYLAPIGPLGPWIVAQPHDVKETIRQSLFHILGEPQGEVTLSGESRVAIGRAAL